MKVDHQSNLTKTVNTLISELIEDFMAQRTTNHST